ncbi:type II toxin-antitoxin system HipA family toxin [Arthrobacter sp.]|uniref:type II toxin-antitoxin system HipA family toxin n=1 Tax=Arthrobacter sp. TaxID=1667 RepID=UPI003A924356
MGGGLPAFFAGLLPEGHRLTVLRRAAKTSMDDELTLLLAVGSDVPGDVQVVPEGEPPVTPEPRAGSAAASLDFAQLAEAPDRHGIPGIQAKASATMLTTRVHAAGLQAILKIDPPDYPHLVLNEALHLKAAQALGLTVATARVVHDRRDRAGLLVERFDRVQDDQGSWIRLAREDAAQVMDILPAAKYNVAAEEVVQALSRVAKAPAVAARNLYLQFVFAWLTGNGDLHAKNLAVLAGRRGGFVVAPGYDTPCTALYRDMTLALPVAGKTRNVRARHWEEFAEAIGLPQRAAPTSWP